MTQTICRVELAPYASHPEHSKGRQYQEKACFNRNDFHRDRDRIIHCAAFRRLKHKTQVFVYHEGDNYRSRLTHTLEVAQIARSVSQALNLHEDLAETIALAHDLGHPPFAHCGEDVLVECMKDYGGFNHNEQCLRIVTDLEHRYAEFDGLNLTWETLEGIAKHNGPIKGRVSSQLKELDKQFNLNLKTYASAEAQVAAISDDIAYNNHDLDDGLRAGFFTTHDLKGLSFVGDIVNEIDRQYPDIEPQRKAYELSRRLMTVMISDLLTQTRKNLQKISPKTADDIRQAGFTVVDFSKDMHAGVKELKQFLMNNMYRHYKVNRIRRKMSLIVEQLFTTYFSEPECLPDAWRARITSQDVDLHGASMKARKIRARVVLDYIAGMTDRYAMNEHRKLFDPYREQLMDG